MDIISSWFLCEERSLHVLGEDETEMMQCINCGYVSTNKFVGKKEDNEEYKKLSGEMKDWSIEKDNRIWIPSIMTLPFGMIYPFNEDNKLKWGYAKMIKIAEENRKNYPIPGIENQFYESMYDTENVEIFDSFLLAMAQANEDAKKFNVEPESIKLPKLKKVNLVKT